MKGHVSIVRIENGKAIMQEEVFRKKVGDTENSPFYITDLPTNLLSTDQIYVSYDPGFLSENESYEPSTELVIIRERPETLEEFKKRTADNLIRMNALRQDRYNMYLKLKAEFEHEGNKENTPNDKKSCHATEDRLTHNACAMQESCETCPSYRV